MNYIQNHLSILGKPVKDKVTGIEGVVVSVSFDLYGCIQTVLSPPVDKDGKIPEPMWLDINRLSILSDEPVMQQPNFEEGRQAEGNQGPAQKPKFKNL